MHQNGSDLVGAKLVKIRVVHDSYRNLKCIELPTSLDDFNIFSLYVAWEASIGLPTSLDDFNIFSLYVAWEASIGLPTSLDDFNIFSLYVA